MVQKIGVAAIPYDTTSSVLVFVPPIFGSEMVSSSEKTQTCFRTVPSCFEWTTNRKIRNRVSLFRNFSFDNKRIRKYASISKKKQRRLVKLKNASLSQFRHVPLSRARDGEGPTSFSWPPFVNTCGMKEVHLFPFAMFHYIGPPTR